MRTVAKKKPTSGRGKGKGRNPWPKRLHDLREFYGKITQEEAASRIDAPAGTWRGWEYGRRLPSPMIIKLLKLTFPEYFAQS